MSIATVLRQTIATGAIIFALGACGGDDGAQVRELEGSNQGGSGSASGSGSGTGHGSGSATGSGTGSN